MGSLKHRLELLTAARIGDSAGGAAVTWSSAAQFWADVALLASTRDYAGDRRRRLRRIAVTARSRADATLGQRVLFNDAPFEIVSIESDDAAAKRMTLICEEAAP